MDIRDFRRLILLCLLVCDTLAFGVRGEGEDVKVGVAAAGEVILLEVEIFHVPSDSTFFWDRNLIHLKRRNPQGVGVLDSEKVRVFRDVLMSQEAKLLSQPTVSFFVGQQCQIAMSIDGMNEPLQFVEIFGSRLNGKDLSMDMSAGLTQKLESLRELDLGDGFTGKWEGIVQLNSTLYMVMRSRNLEDPNNYIFLLTFQRPRGK